ncbi:hypothetical protein [Endozoicomonas euniceicola]|uniref:Uncharacterized protein n=1 Tax=Endozoicomonas euniceicola TaxID=1234143 RepID=A0ABY6GZ59_9GAMM|nr:hypothetical protein [Endozoicomonas euniceicola]UYM17336.1 hypothetical protein NX720_05265 [Endozoicomonas euniceicola]
MSHNKYKNDDLQSLVDNYMDSGLSAREYVEACVDSGEISAAEALKLLSVLRDAQSVTFKLAEVSDPEHSGLQMTLKRKGADLEQPPLFRIFVDEDLNDDKDEVIDLLQNFAKELAVVATREELAGGEAVDSTDENPEEWLSHPNIMPASDTRH